MAAVEAEAEAAEALLPSKLRAMEAEGLPAWKVQATEAEEREKILSLIQNKIHQLHMENKALSSGCSSEAEREAIEAKAKEDRASLMRVFKRVAAGIRSPDYSGMTEAERAAEAERLRQLAREEARRLEQEGDRAWRGQELVARIIDFDPKQDGLYYNRMYHPEETFDLDDESPFGPMRFTDQVYGKDNRPSLGQAINILSVNISCSDVGFPIQVYGSVIARDSVDHKCLYLFRRDADHCQMISSKDEPLILTGPKRGLVLLTENLIETDLKIKDHQGQDRELSKGILGIRDIAGRPWDKCEVERYYIETRLSTVDVLYAVVKSAVEGTVAITVLKGRFYGTITAHTRSIQNRILLYDSNVAGAKRPKTNLGHGVIQLMRSAVSVSVRDMLIIDAMTSAGKSACLEFTPKVNGTEEVVINLGATKMCVKLAWSIMELD